jgi:hypothetical protein
MLTGLQLYANYEGKDLSQEHTGNVENISNIETTRHNYGIGHLFPTH